VEQQDERDDRPERNADDPRHLYAGAVGDPVDEEIERRTERRGREDRVLEQAEPAHAKPGLLRRNSRVDERLLVEREAAAGGEDAEPRRHERARVVHGQLRPFVRTRELAVRERIAEQARDEAAQRDEEPRPARMRETSCDLTEACRPGDAEQRGGCEDERDSDGDRDLAAAVLAMMARHVPVENGSQIQHVQSCTPSRRVLSLSA